MADAEEILRQAARARERPDHAAEALHWLSQPRDPGTVALAQVYATLAVAQELRELRESLPAALLEALGDGSHLDKLVGAARDLADTAGAMRGELAYRHGTRHD